MMTYTARPAQLSEEAKAVEDAYLRDLAWQSRRTRALNDRLERVSDRLETAGVFVLQAHSKFAIEDYLTRQGEAERRKMKRRF